MSFNIKNNILVITSIHIENHQNEQVFPQERAFQPQMFINKMYD